MERFEGVGLGAEEGEARTDFGNRSHIVGRASQRRLLRRYCGSIALAMINGVSMGSFILGSVGRKGEANFFPGSADVHVDNVLSQGLCKSLGAKRGMRTCW